MHKLRWSRGVLYAWLAWRARDLDRRNFHRRRMRRAGGRMTPSIGCSCIMLYHVVSNIPVLSGFARESGLFPSTLPF